MSMHIKHVHVEERARSADNGDIRKVFHFLNEQYFHLLSERKVSPELDRALREITPLAPHESDVRLISSEQNAYLG